MWSVGLCKLQDLGPDLKQGQTGFSAHAGTFTCGCSVEDGLPGMALETVRGPELRLAERGA